MVAHPLGGRCAGAFRTKIDAPGGWRGGLSHQQGRFMATNPIELQASLPAKPAGFKPGGSAFFAKENLIFVIPILAALALIGVRANGYVPNILKEGNLTVVALLSYLSASAVYVTYLVGRESLMLRIGSGVMAFGYVMNLAAWGVRWVEYVEFAKSKPAIAAAWAQYSLSDKISHTYPLNNLYDIGLAFTGFAVLASLIIVSRKRYQMIGAITMPIAALVLTLVVFLGNDITTLQPILRSYWRPIHVSIAAISYGVCLVSFGVALLYLLKDNVRIESVGAWIAALGVVTYAVIGDFSVLTHFAYGLGVRSYAPDGTSSGLTLLGGGVLRATLPGVGPLMVLGTLLYAGAGVLLAAYVFKSNRTAQLWGNRLVLAAFAAQIVIFGAISFQMRTVNANIAQYVNPAQHQALGGRLVKLSEQDPAQFAPQQLTEFGANFMAQPSVPLKIAFTSNPVELSMILTLLFATGLVSLFVWRGKTILETLPSLESLDDLVYKTVSVVFPMLAMMLITGAVWANESWGTYWSWDPKETWALVTWLAYAGYLHTRIVHGWKGRSSAYFAVIGFIFVIFTYLGVSFLLPGLHSYAGVD
jgi:ABC-type transport system involved in cytochrome c biogenesis permease subunit